MKRPRMKSRAQIEAAHAIIGHALEAGVGRSCPTTRVLMVSSLEVLCWVLHGNPLFDLNIETTARSLEAALSPEGILEKLPTSGPVQ